MNLQDLFCDHSKYFFQATVRRNSVIYNFLLKSFLRY
jgi:hypothetical protein